MNLSLLFTVRGAPTDNPLMKVLLSQADGRYPLGAPKKIPPNLCNISETMHPIYQEPAPDNAVVITEAYIFRAHSSDRQPNDRHRSSTTSRSNRANSNGDSEADTDP